MNEVLRREEKYLISLTDYYRLSRKLGRLMQADPHNRDEGYPVRSLYFDSLDDRDFSEKEDGVELRRKLRLRCYGPESDVATLEMKQKEGNLQLKRSVRLERDAAIRLTHGDYAPLLNCTEPFALECYALMQTHCYLPRSVVEYRRLAFMAEENNTRITFDHKIAATEANFDIFDPKLPLYPVFGQELAVLEVKYNGFLLSYIKDLLREVDGSTLSISKYIQSRSVGKHLHF